ncbi:MAG: hypothetical protein HDP34_01370, partial [Clostridia bacterium]|nr:hypothetical protein [Clostridia bacterium]
MKFTKIKNAIIFALLSVLLAATVAFGAVFATKNIEDNSLPVQASSAGADNIGAITNGSFNSFGAWNIATIRTLVHRLAGDTTASIATLSSNTSITSTKGLTQGNLRTNNHKAGGTSNYNVEISLGGYNWLVTYVSKNRSGDIIATLWMSTAVTTLAWHDYTSTATVTYPSDLYTSSKIRSYLTGSTYVKNSSGTSTGAYTASTTSAGTTTTSPMITFGNTYKTYFDQPKNIAWQETLRAKDTVTFGSNRHNEAYTNTGDVSYTGTNYTNKGGAAVDGIKYYNLWQNDYVWLPAIAEASQHSKSDGTHNGLWVCSSNARKDTTGTWVRSSEGDGSKVWRIAASGAASTGVADGTVALTSVLGVRPAVHLNLTKVCSAAGAYKETKPYFLTTQNTGITRTSNTVASATYNGSAQTVKIYETTFSTPTLSSGSSSLSGTTRSVSGTSANTYTITYKLASGYVWADNTTADVVLTFTINKATKKAHFYDTGHSTGVTISSDKKTATATYTGSAITFKAYEDGDMSTPTCPTGVTSGSYSGTDKYRLLTVTNPGTYTVSWTITSTTNYQWDDGSAGSVAKSITIKVLNASPDVSGIGFANKTVTYSGSGQSISYTGTLPTGVSSAAVTYKNSSGTAVTSPTNAGTYTATLTFTAATNYNTPTAKTATLTINRAVITPTWSTTTSFTYSGAVQGVTLSSTSSNGAALAASSISVYYSGNTYSNTAVATAWGNSSTQTTRPSAVGSYTATARLTTTQAANYTFSSTTAAPSTTSTTTATKAFTINRAVLTPTWSTTTSWTYDGLEHAVTITSTSTTGASLTPSVYYSGTSNGAAWGNNTSNTTKPVNAGSYTATARLTAAQGANYTFSSTTAAYNTNSTLTTTKDFTIGKRALTLVWSYTGATDTTTHTYTFIGNPQGPDASYSNLASKDSALIPAVTYKGTTNGGIEFERTSPKITGAGRNYTATVSTDAPSANYTLTVSEPTVTWHIAKAVVNSVTYDKLTFTYTGEVQCPVLTGLTTATAVNDDRKPLSMFEITGGQTDAGNHVVTATIKPEYATQFTTSATDENLTQRNTTYVINKAVLAFTLGNDFVYGMKYNGLAQIPELTLVVPSTVIESARPTVDDFSKEIKAQSGSHLTSGSAVDVGGYTVTLRLPKAYSKNFTLSETSQNVASTTLSFKIYKADITP